MQNGRHFPIVCALSAGVALVSAATSVATTQLDVMSAGAMEAAIAPLAVEFQRSSGHSVTVSYNTAPELGGRLVRGDSADVLIAPATVVDQAMKDGRTLGSTRISVGRIGVGVFVRSGAPTPNVASESDLRSALLAAERIVYTQGSSGQHIEAVLTRLGVEGLIAARRVRVPDAESALDRVARGTSADLGFGAITAIKAFEGRGTTFVAALPESLQNFTPYDGIVMTGASERRVAEDFLQFLRSPSARRVMEAAGVRVTPDLK
jgi:molybdate transport system substrate-binding protein